MDEDRFWFWVIVVLLLLMAVVPAPDEPRPAPPAGAAARGAKPGPDWEELARAKRAETERTLRAVRARIDAALAR